MARPNQKGRDQVTTTTKLWRRLKAQVDDGKRQTDQKVKLTKLLLKISP